MIMNTPLLEEKTSKMSLGKIMCVCASTLGFESAFNVLYSLTEPIMTKLSMSENARFICWLAGPLAGLLLLPIVGVLSDRCKSKLGRRRPYIIGGCAFTMLGFFLLYMLQIYGSKLPMIVVSISMFVLLFLNYASMNTMTGPSRALIGDIIPEEQQDIANSIASIFIGISSVLPNVFGGIGYFISDPTYSEKADSITLIFCIILTFICVTITCVTSKEEPIKDIEIHNENPFKQLFLAMKTIPSSILRACIIMILSWIANYMFTMMGTEFFMDEVFPPEESSRGLCFGMLVIASANALSFLYGCFHAYLSSRIGYKWTYAISHIIEALSLISVFFIHDPWPLFACLTFVGMAIANFNSTPYTIVGLAADENTMCVYMSVLSTCIDVSYLLANILINLCGSKIFNHFYKSSWPITRLQTLIGFSSIFAVITAIYSFFLKIPAYEESAEPVLYTQDREPNEYENVIISRPDEDEVNQCPEL